MKKKKPSLTRARILKTLRDHDEALKTYSVKRIGLFGSFARGEQKRGSDIDLLVEFEKPTYDNFYDLIVYLEKLFGRKVQVLTPAGCSRQKPADRTLTRSGPFSLTLLTGRVTRRALTRRI